MANHCYVKTKKKMTPELISGVLNNLNVNIFKNNLQIEYAIGDKNSWGPHLWFVDYQSPIDNIKYAERVMWLKTSCHFELRHGGGGEFAWWMDHVITNQLALKFNGTITDDGLGDQEIEIKVGNYDLLEYLNKSKNKSLLEFIPQEFRI